MNTEAPRIGIKNETSTVYFGNQKYTDIITNMNTRELEVSAKPNNETNNRGIETAIDMSLSRSKYSAPDSTLFSGMASTSKNMNEIAIPSAANPNI